MRQCRYLSQRGPFVRGPNRYCSVLEIQKDFIKKVTQNHLLVLVLVMVMVMVLVMVLAMVLVMMLVMSFPFLHAKDSEFKINFKLEVIKTRLNLK